MDRGKWDHTARPFSLPKGLRLLLADVDAGTDTPSFVGKVLNWRKENEVVADELWGHLGKANDSLGDLLQSLAGLQGEEGYEAVLRDAARVPVSKVSLGLLRLVVHACARVYVSLPFIGRIWSG